MKNKNAHNFVNIELSIDEMAEVSKIRKEKEKNKIKRNKEFKELIKTLKKETSKEKLSKKECTCSDCDCTFEVDCQEDCLNKLNCDCDVNCAYCDNIHCGYSCPEDEDEYEDSFSERDLLDKIEEFITNNKPIHLSEDEYSQICEIIDLSLIDDELINDFKNLKTLVNKKYIPKSFDEIYNKFTKNEFDEYTYSNDDLLADLKVIEKESISCIKNKYTFFNIKELPLPSFNKNNIDIKPINIKLIEKLIELGYTVCLSEDKLSIYLFKVEKDQNTGLIRIKDKNTFENNNIIDITIINSAEDLKDIITSEVIIFN